MSRRFIKIRWFRIVVEFVEFVDEAEIEFNTLKYDLYSFSIKFFENYEDKRDVISGFVFG